jgi:hypothetical protein
VINSVYYCTSKHEEHELVIEFRNRGFYETLTRVISVKC